MEDVHVISSSSWWRDTIRLVRSLHNIKLVFKDGTNDRALYSDQDIILRIPALGESSEAAAGWRFAAPLVYDFETQYAKHEVVFVGEENTAVTADVPDHGEEAARATPGLWVCYRPPRVLVDEATTVHLPTWQSPTEAEVEEIYWMPIWLVMCPD